MTLKNTNPGHYDVELLCRFFEAGLKCFTAFNPAKTHYNARAAGDVSLKEVVEAFCAVFVHVDPLVFLEVIETKMDFFFQELMTNPELYAIPQTLLSSEGVSPIFVGILFRFLIGRLERLGQPDKEYAAVMLKLFKMSFMAVTIFPEANEAPLQPHLSNIIMSSLRLASKATEPGNYYQLLRALFRSIGGGRFELLYKEVLPLLQVLLENLNGLLNAADKSKRDIFVELCLTVPVRLSVLLPYLSHLMKPLVYALQAGPELVSQGLRTLELCVDNLTQEFLNPLMAPVIQDVMAALWKLLRPIPFSHQHAHTTMRILGKVGGRNRKDLGPPRLEWKPVGEAATMPVHFDESVENIKLAPTVDLACTLIKRGDTHYRSNAYVFFKHAAVFFLHGVSPGLILPCFRFADSTNSPESDCWRAGRHLLQHRPRITGRYSC